jgi:GntR family transcriptional regulator
MTVAGDRKLRGQTGEKPGRSAGQLRDEGVVEFRRGRGVTVCGIGQQRSAVVAKARELVALARRYGYRPEELAEIIEQVS